MNFGSSTRLTGVPRTSTAMSVSSGRRGGGRPVTHDAGGLADRQDDVVVAGAAADVALDRVPDLGVGGVAVVHEQVRGGHDHTRRAEAALEPVLLPEALLQRVQVDAVAQALDRRDARPV